MDTIKVTTVTRSEEKATDVVLIEHIDSITKERTELLLSRYEVKELAYKLIENL